MAKIKIIPYGHQWLDDNDIKEVIKVLKGDWLTQGPKIEEFEKAVAKYCGAKYGVAVSSGTAALHAAYSVAGISSGDEIITTPMTFAATANAAVFCGARPVFVDIRSDTLNINSELIEGLITSKTKAIVPVDFAGHPCDYEEIFKIARKHNLLVIEDACHALGAKYKGKKVGSFSDMTILSFHPVKHITTGEGGAVLTNDETLYKKLKRLKSHGITFNPKEFVNNDLALQSLNSGGIKPLLNPWYYEQTDLGYNYRLTDIQCALGLSQLKKLDIFRKRRREIVNKYNAAFRDAKFVHIPCEDDKCNSNFHLYVLLFDFEKIGIERARLMLELKSKGIQTQVHYIPVYLQPFYQKHFGTKWGDCQNAEHYYQRCLSMPLFPAMADQDVERVVEEINNLVRSE